MDAIKIDASDVSTNNLVFNQNSTRANVIADLTGGGGNDQFNLKTIGQTYMDGGLGNNSFSIKTFIGNNYGISVTDGPNKYFHFAMPLSRIEDISPNVQGTLDLFFKNINSIDIFKFLLPDVQVTESFNNKVVISEQVSLLDNIA